MRMPIRLPPAGSRRFDVVGFGLNSLDLVAVVPSHPGPNSKLAIQQLAQLPGGQIATAMVACARLGWRSRYIGRFGDDAHGAIGVESLQREGVETSCAERIPGATSHFSIVIVDSARGERTVMWHRHPGLAFPIDALPADAVREGRVLLVDGFETAAAARAAEVAQAAGMATVIDVEEVRPDIEVLLEHTDVIIVAEDFPREMTGVASTGEALAALAVRFPRASVVCATLGEEGSLARCAGREIRTPAFPVHCVDSTGAGDAFRAGFIAAWLKGGDAAEIEEVLRYANAAAALNCRGVGAQVACPGPHEVEVLLHSK